jgi:hypothetical protein
VPGYWNKSGEPGALSMHPLDKGYKFFTDSLLSRNRPRLWTERQYPLLSPGPQGRLPTARPRFAKGSPAGAKRLDLRVLRLMLARLATPPLPARPEQRARRRSPVERLVTGLNVRYSRHNCNYKNLVETLSYSVLGHRCCESLYQTVRC